MANLKNLREVDASKNQISSFPVGLTNLKNLNIVDLSSNKVNEAFLLVSITDELS
jgi:Leucine-rich repeat (LRR) protein